MVMNVSVLTPKRIVCVTTSEQVIIPAYLGQVGVLTGHVPLVASIELGVLQIRAEEKWLPIILFGGIAYVGRKQVIILVDDVEEAPIFTTYDTAEDLKKATDALASAETSKDRVECLANLQLALARSTAVGFLS
jgi:F-type H+-transporting ATPase subunit epsilon